ncbi:MAG: 4Fe-4S ferredoxin, iron-sulpur binding protein [Firmicutes bacterium]|nr:4Fe-4S ferredoxin, iron-sulpur binding protein [Bacillota bacterium]
MAKKLAFLVNCEACIGCHACENACKNEYQQEASVRWRKVYPMQEKSFDVPVRVHVSLACNHCEEPACMKVCPAKAYTKREDGIVIHDNEACIGCKLCMMACPYQVPCYDKNLGKVTKCDMCAARQDDGELPACVKGCPMDALAVIDLQEEKYQKLKASLPGYPKNEITHPTTRFVAATVGKQIRRGEE